MAIVPEDTYQAEDQTPVKMDTSEPAVDMSQPEPDPLFSYSEAELQKLNAFQIEQQNVTPEAAKTALDQESNMGMPSDFNDPITGTFSDLGKISVQSIQKDAPRFTSWLSENKHHLPLAADDIQTMKDMEFGIDELSTLDELYNTAGSAFSGFNAMVAKTPAFLYNVAAAPQNFVADALNIPSLKATADLENSVSKYFGEQQKVFAEKVPELSQSAFAELSNGNFLKAARITLYQALQSAPTSIALGTASIAGAMATRVGLATAGAISGADKAQEYQDAGMSPSKAAVMAIPSAIYEAGFESLAIGKITQGFAEQITKAMGSQTAKEWAKAVSKGLAYSFAQEASEETMTSIANDLTDNIIGVSNYSFGEIASRAVDAGLVGGVAGGAGVGGPVAMSGVYRSQAMRQAQLQKDFYTALSEKSERSALKARLPEKFQEAVASMTKDGPVENIYVNAEALESYFQSKGDGKLAEFLNSVDANESYDAAIESGGLVKIPTAVWATKVAGTDVHKGMADDITFDPSKFTLNESKQIEDVSPETMKLAEERLSSPDVAGSTPAQIQKMMEEVGIPKAVARQASQVWRHIDVLQTRTPNAKKLFDQIKLTFNRNGMTSTKPAIQPEGFAPTPINQAINGPIEGYAYKKEAIENLSAAVMGIETDTSKLVGFAQQGDRAGSENIQRLAGYTIGEPFIMQVRNKYDRLDKKEIQKIVQKALDGKKLTVGQQAIFDELYRASGYDKEYSSASADIPKTEEDFMLQMAGRKSNTHNAKTLAKAEQMRLAGEDLEKIRKETGWLYGKENRWSYEIGDAGAKFKKLNLNKKKNYKLSEVLDHPELYEAYPQLKDIDVQFFAFKGRSLGSFNLQTKLIRVGLSLVSESKQNSKFSQRMRELENTPEYLALFSAINDFGLNTKEHTDAQMVFLNTEVGKEYQQLARANQMIVMPKTYPKELGDKDLRVFLHEIQHAIQDIEGFAQGGNRKADGKVKYENSLGEINARDAEARRLMNDEERRQTPLMQSKVSMPFIKWGSVKEELPIEEVPQSVVKDTLNQDVPEGGQLALFQGEQDAKGKITFDRAQKIFNIEWLKNADLTTFLHESAHMFLEINTYLANDPDTSEEVKADYKKILDYVGLKDGEQLKTKHHEKFAEAFEKYLMTGKAPTSELRQAFATIKSWFISIYHSIKNLYPNVELNEEITGVFDRMLATDSEIERAKEDIAADPMIKEAISVMKPDEAARYLKAIESEKKSAEELIYAEALKEYTREERAKRKARKVEIQAQVEAELKPQYIVYDALTDGITMQDGSTVKMKLDRKEIEDVYGAQIANKIPASVYGSNASGLDVVASTLVDPFASGATVVKILSEQMPKQKAIKREVNSRLDAEFGDPVADGTIGDLADAAVHNVDGAKRRLIELDFLIQNNPKEFKRQAGIIARRRLVTEAQFRRRAEITIGTMNLKEIKPSQFKRAEAKNGNEAFKAFQAGDYAAAIDFKQKELLNFELHRLSIMANDEVQNGLNKFNKFFASDEKLAKRRSIEYINAGRAILAKFGLGETERTPESYLEQIKKYDEEGYAVAKAQYDAIEIPSKKYTDLSFNEFVSIKDSVDALWDLSRADNQIMVEGKMISKAQALEEIMADYDKMSPVKTRKELGELTTKEKIEAAFLSAKQALVRIEAWADYMGPSFRKYIYEPISSAATNYRIARKDYAERVKKMVDAYAKTVDFEKAIATELGGMDGTFKNKYELIGALLHTGNASNYKKLLLGNKWGTRNEDGSLNDQAFKSQLAKYFANGTITKTDMDFVQSIWDLLEEMKPAAQQAHKAMYGYYFSEITANEIVTPFGAYKGGYYPAVIDRNRTSSAAQEKKVFDASAELQSQSQMFPQTNNGFTKNRVENFSDKLQMNLMLAASHIDRVLKFTHMSPAVKDVQKILMSRDFKARLRNDDPEFFGNALLPWIQRSSLQVVSTPPNSLLEKIMAGARTRAAAQIMLLNVGNTLQQYTGIVVGMSKVKAKYIRQSMGSLLTKKTELYEAIQKLSPFMVTRMDSQMETMSQAIDKILDPKNKFEQVRDFAVQNTYVLQSAAQNQVDAIVWMGAYNQALDKGLTSAQAVKDADSIVRLTQGSFSPEDVAKFEAGSPALRMFTLFSGYWNMVLNLAGTEGMKTLKESGLKSGAGRLTYLYMTIFLVPAVISGIIARAMWGAPFDEDDDGDIADDLLFNAMGDQFKTILSLVPIAGPTAISAYNRLFTENPFDDRLNLSPVLVALESVAGFPKAAYKLAVDDEIKRKDVKDVLTAVSMFTGVPVTPIAKPINYLLDVDSGKANPENPIDFTRGLVSGSAGGKQ